MAGQTQPVLTADELVLHPWTPADVPALVAAYEDPAIQRWHGRSMTAAEARGWVDQAHRGWAAETAASWAVTDGEVLVGRMSWRTIDLAEGLAEAAYWVCVGARGAGVAPRALTSITDWALALGLHRLEVHHSSRNPASCRVADRAGYTYEATKRSQGRHIDGWHDMHLHARLGAD